MRKPLWVDESSDFQLFNCGISVQALLDCRMQEARPPTRLARCFRSIESLYDDHKS